MGARATAPVVMAAGVLPWRLHEGCLQVALVHRPRYDDWSWAKGKLEAGEDWAVAAVRETREETGLTVRLGLPLPPSFYPVGSQSSDGLTVKQVRYWAGPVLHDSGRLEHEIDQVAWLSPTLAERRLSYSRDREQLEALVAAHQEDRLDVSALLVVRHAKAVARGDWDRRDEERPLDPAGRRRAEELTGLLTAYGVRQLLTSPAARCLDSVTPYLRADSSVTLETKASLSEEGHDDRPAKAASHLARLLGSGQPSALCTHGAVLPDLLTALADRADPSAVPVLCRAARSNLDKGEVLACVVAGEGDDAHVVGVERHRPPRG